ncbi:hypothetical protein ACFV1B_14875 [Streptomyces sp. NPDC059637]|uniref:hypothetical protein n=1 Tax=Streptomyces sp. NPDC059637 TaxID=3347752 RepID=UPI0036870539
MHKAAEAVNVDFVASRHLAGGGPAWAAAPAIAPAAHPVTAFTRTVAGPLLPRTNAPLSVPAYGTKIVTCVYRELPAVRGAFSPENRGRALAA